MMQVPMKMQKTVTTSIATLAMALAISPVALTQSAAPSAPKNQPAFDPRDLSGQWSGGLGGGLHTVGKAPALLPDAQSRFDANTAEMKTTGVITVDPTFSCEPPGVPRIY